MTRTQPNTLTANGAAAYSSTENPILNLFSFPATRFKAKGRRIKNISPVISQGNGQETRGEILNKLLEAAYSQDKALTLRCLFFIRDIRGEGRGDRQMFRDALVWLESVDPETCKKILSFIPEVGRWDDLLCFQTTEVKKEAASLIKKALDEGNGLCAKWMPRVKSANKRQAIDLAHLLGWGHARYRKTLAALTLSSQVVETKMCAREWDEIVYEKVPSLAALRNQNAFKRHDEARFARYTTDLILGKTKAHVGTLFPYNLYKLACTPGMDQDLINARWKLMPELVTEGIGVLPMSDVSGSMSCLCGDKLSAMDISISMGIYLAEKAPGPFRNLMLTFASNSHLFHLGDNTNLKQKADMIRQKCTELGSTNLASAFKAILDIGVKHNLSKEQMPKILAIFSDLHFDRMCMYIKPSEDKKGNPSPYTAGTSMEDHTTGFQMAKALYEKHGYDLPLIVFWNLNPLPGTSALPVVASDKGAVLLSGFSIKAFQAVLSLAQNIEEEAKEDGKKAVDLAQVITPEAAMMQALMNPRYDFGFERIVG